MPPHPLSLLPSCRPPRMKVSPAVGDAEPRRRRYHVVRRFEHPEAGVQSSSGSKDGQRRPSFPRTRLGGWAIISGMSAELVPPAPAPRSEAQKGGASTGPSLSVLVRGRTVPRRGEEPILLVDLLATDGSSVGANLFVEDLLSLPPAARLLAVVPNQKRDGFVRVPVRVRRGLPSELGAVDLQREPDGRSIIALIPEFVRDARQQRWLRPQPRAR